MRVCNLRYVGKNFSVQCYIFRQVKEEWVIAFQLLKNFFNAKIWLGLISWKTDSNIENGLKHGFKELKMFSWGRSLDYLKFLNIFNFLLKITFRAYGTNKCWFYEKIENSSLLVDLSRNIFCSNNFYRYSVFFQFHFSKCFPSQITFSEWLPPEHIILNIFSPNPPPPDFLSTWFTLFKRMCPGNFKSSHCFIVNCFTNADGNIPFSQHAIIYARSWYSFHENDILV